MGIFGPSQKQIDAAVARVLEARSIENPTVPVSSAGFLSFFGVDSGVMSAGELVNTETALGVPAIWAAVNFISGTLAGLPLQVYRKTDAGRERVSGGLATVLHDAVNDGLSSFQWRKCLFDQVLTGGRAFSYIERNGAGKVQNIWPLDPCEVTVKREGARLTYEYREGGRVLRYAASEVIDVAFMLKGDMLCHRSPIHTNRDVIGLAIAATKYGARFFQNGGVPPLQLVGPLNSAQAISRAATDITEALSAAKAEGRPILPMPNNHELKPIGTDPQKSQLVEVHRFVIEQIARIYSLPPTFLQDLSHGTFSNTEQQDLHFVKHTLKRWVEQFEQELNLKLFGRGNGRQYVELNVDGLLRGDFKTRMEGMAQAIQNALMTPNEGRALLNLPDDPMGGALLIQGATVPLGQQPKTDQQAGGQGNAA